MKILIVSFVDDNFGDNLIRISFEQLLNVVLSNLNIPGNEYQIDKMPLKAIDEQAITNADIIFFAGGGLFGLSYLNFFSYLDTITQIASDNDIPVVFSSIGINNMDATEDGEEMLKKILQRKCIKAISVRENIGLFEYYAQGCNFSIKQVCDPAVWTQYVYNMRDTKKSQRIGINVVRGGLFKDNQKNWGMTDELKYLNDLKIRLDERGLEYVFYTNGSVLDNNTLRYFAREYNIPQDRIIYTNTTKEVIDTVAACEAVITFRMHSSIIAYAFNIPSIALAWNDKIPFFYENVNHSDRVFLFENWNGEVVFNKLISILESQEKDKLDIEYLMSLYQYLYDTLSTLLVKKETSTNNAIYDFETVANKLCEYSCNIDEDIFDLRFKLDKAEKQYLARFTELRRKDKELKKYKKETDRLKQDCDAQKTKINEFEAELQKRENQINKQKEELNWLNKRFLVRLIKKFRRRLNTRAAKSN